MTQELGELLPEVRVRPPGPASLALAERLRAVESRNVTYLGPDFPVFWTDAVGANVRDADGNVYIDLTAAFGVALAGHRHPGVTAAIREQADRLVHGMGDVHPPEAKVRFLERVCGLLEEEGGLASPRAVMANTGSEAVEIALKTGHLVTGRPGVVAFRGGYHGLTLGALSATARPYFREPFEARLPSGVAWLDFPTEEARVPEVLRALEELLADGLPDGIPVGSVIIEPVQARGGVRVPAAGFPAALSRMVRGSRAVLIADEIYTGMGRCGALLGSRVVGLDPQVVCLGKVLGGGLPVSVCAGEAAVMDAWPESPGEALHTSTFLGHPLACAAGMAMLNLVHGGLPQCAEELGSRMLASLRTELDGAPGVRDVRGVGLLLGIELAPGQAVAAAEHLLAEGIIVLPAGDHGEVLELSPPAALTTEQEAEAVRLVCQVVRRVASS